MQDDNAPDPYDRLLGALDGLPDVIQTKPAPVRTVTPLVGNAETWTVQTVRQLEQGDTIFLERTGRDGFIRLAIPPKVSAVIARQRDALTTKARRKAARAGVETRRAAGVVPFQKKKAAAE